MSPSQLEQMSAVLERLFQDALGPRERWERLCAALALAAEGLESADTPEEMLCIFTAATWSMPAVNGRLQ